MELYVSVVMKFPFPSRATGRLNPQSEFLNLARKARLEEIICTVQGTTPTFRRGDQIHPKVRRNLGAKADDAVMTVYCAPMPSSSTKAEEKAIRIVLHLIRMGFRAVAWKEEVFVMTRPPDEMPLDGHEGECPYCGRELNEEGICDSDDCPWCQTMQTLTSDVQRATGE